MTDKKSNVIKTFFKLLPNAEKASPILFIVILLVNILNGVSLGVITLFTQRFFDESTAFVEGHTAITSVIISLLWFGFTYAIWQVLQGVGNFIPEVYAEKLHGNLSIDIHKKMAKLSPVDFENTNLLDNINKAVEGKNNAVDFAIIFFFIFAFYIPYFTFMSFYLFSLKPILVISIVIVFIPILATQIIRAKIFANLEDKAVLYDENMIIMKTAL